MSFANSETPEHIRTTLGAILRRYRETNEWSLADIAGPAGISTAYLSEVERGRKDVSTERLLAVARALDVTVADIYLELARELGAGEPLNAVAWEADPRVQLRRMSDSLDYDALQTVARFTTFLAMTEGTQRKRPIGFLR
jgi:transcriptional regulator with XRE-family HTH domain